MTYARARLRLSLLTQALGIGICAALLLTGAWSHLTIALPWTAGAWLALFLLVFNLLLLPLEWVGGYRLPAQKGRIQGSGLHWAGKWLRAATVQGLLYWLIGLSVYYITAWLGFWGGVGWVFILMLLITGFQLYIALAIAPIKMQSTSHRGRLLFYLDSADKRFTGGIYGVPGQESIVLPTYWKERFSAAVQDILLARRHGAINTGSHGRGVFLAIAWNTAGFALSAWLSTGGPGTVAGLLETSCWFTLFSLLAHAGPLPWLSRRAVLEIDRWVYYKGFDADALRDSFTQTHRLQEEYAEAAPVLSRWSRAFPTLEMRQENLRTQAPIKGGWQASRHAVYASWAGLNLLARTQAYHLGLPELWVFQPGD